jgi:NADPH:quinone reductase-like Zn-dependent oxidoreductase
MKTGQGALAQFVRVPADNLVIRPHNVTPIQAAGLSLAGLTAYQVLHEIAEIEAEQTVFINGGSTAVGAFAIQIAKAAGAKVSATASAKNEDFVRGLGADEFIDYSKVNLAKYLVDKAPSPKFNIIFDAVGLIESTLYTSSGAYLAPGGIFVTTGPLPQKGSASEFWQLLKTFGAILTPSWLGGPSQAYRRVNLIFTYQNKNSSENRIVVVANKQKDLQALQKLVMDGQR